MTSKGKYIKSEGKYLIGTFTAHARGFGFVSIEGEEEDIFIPESQVHGAFHMDTVQVAVTSENSGKRREGTITKIISRGTTRIVCTYEKSKTFGFAVPDNPKFGSDIFIPQERSKGAVSGHKVVVEITDYGKEGRKPEGKVVEIIGHINDPGVDILSVIKAYGLPEEYPDEVMDQVEGIESEVAEEEKEAFQKKSDSLVEIFRKELGNENLDVKIEKLKDENVASMMTLSEENRRMQEMMKMYGMNGMDMGTTSTLILNANHPLVKYVAAHKEDDKNVPLICQQLYDLAMMAHKQLSPDEMTQFIARSNQILLALAK